MFGKFYFIACLAWRQVVVLSVFQEMHSVPETSQCVHMETNHIWTHSQRICAEAPFMAIALNSQKQSRSKEGGWKRTVHQRQCCAQSSYRSKHAGQHCCSFTTELRNATWKVCVPGTGITHSSETWWTCLQGHFRWTCLQDEILENRLLIHHWDFCLG